MSIRVAVYEDNDDLREALGELVSSTPGLELASSRSSCERVAEEASNHRPDVVVMDIGLPGCSGVEGVRRLKTAHPEIEVLMLTVYEDEQRIFEAICAGASGYLLKMATADAIVRAIREVNDGGAPMTPRVARHVLGMFQRGSSFAAANCLISSREREVLSALVDGCSYKMIADRLGVSVDTVRSHIKHIYEKLHVHSKSEAVVKALRNGLI
jgi:DNA-binding NarL/FixJ family response regulator